MRVRFAPAIAGWRHAHQPCILPVLHIAHENAVFDQDSAIGRRTLIVDDTLNPSVYAYDVQADGTVKNKRTFAQLRDIPPGAESGADGMAVDRDDRVYITTVAGVQVFDAAGRYLGTIKSARQGANVAFAGPDKRTLYITAREGLYRIKTLAQGPDRLGK